MGCTMAGEIGRKVMSFCGGNWGKLVRDEFSGIGATMTGCGGGSSTNTVPVG